MIGTGVKARDRNQPLVISAEHDRTVTPFVARGSYNVQKKSPARTDFHQFADRSHFLAGEKGWEEVANYALGWANEVLTPAALH